MSARSPTAQIHRFSTQVTFVAIFHRQRAATGRCKIRMKMIALPLCVLAVHSVAVMAYLPFMKEHLLTDALLREVVDRMGKDLADPGDNYMDLPDPSRQLPLPERSSKNLENQDHQYAMDYETLNRNPSIRDREYQEHSSQWGSQYDSGDSNDRSSVSKQRLKPVFSVHLADKNDAALPAYCNPPNPCPAGYFGEYDCLEQFDNTAAFSREYQAAQDCMCDSEHMFDCSARLASRDMQSSAGGDDLTESEIDSIIQQFQIGGPRKSLVAKKFHVKKSSNPYLSGEKLPVAAKKGIDVVN